MASVRIEAEAFGDDRYDDLADYAKLADADHARGKMARLWRQCTIEQTHILTNDQVCRVLGPGGVEALVKARLGERSGRTRVRIRGTEGRIEWLRKLRENGRKGGRPSTSDKPNGLAVPEPSGSAELNPLTLALAPSLSPAQKQRESRRVKAPASPLPDSWTPNQSHVDLASKRGVDVQHEAAKFRAHAEANGRTQAHWPAAFTQWLLSSHPPRQGSLSVVPNQPVRQIKTLTP